jgi:pteridine reductase
LPATLQRMALVTGSGKKRVGWHVADALAGRGYDIAVHYRTSAKEAAETVEHLRGRGVEAVAFQADLSDEHAVHDLFRGLQDRFGRLDVLVNCAAVYQAKRLEEVTAADLRHNFDANLLGTFLCAQQAGLTMVRQPEGGCIVNLGDWALARPYLNYAAYFATKGAIPALTRCLAVELGTRNPRVRVNCIMPGPFSSHRTCPRPSARRQSGPRWRSTRGSLKTSRPRYFFSWKMISSPAPASRLTAAAPSTRQAVEHSTGRQTVRW